MRSIEDLKRGRDASTALVAIAIVAVLAVAAVGVYVFVLQDDDNDDEKEKRTVIQGTMGIGTTFEYEDGGDGTYSLDSGMITIVGQNEDHYLLEYKMHSTDYHSGGSIGIIYRGYVMMHKENGSIDFADKVGPSDIDGADEWYMIMSSWEYIGEPDPEMDDDDLKGETGMRIISGILNGKPIIYSFTTFDGAVIANYVEDSVDITEATEYTPSEDLWKGRSYNVKKTATYGNADAEYILTNVAEIDDAFAVRVVASVTEGTDEAGVVSDIIAWEETIFDFDPVGYTEKGTETLDTIDGRLTVTVYIKTEPSIYNNDDVCYTELYVANEIVYKYYEETRDSVGDIKDTIDFVLTGWF